MNTSATLAAIQEAFGPHITTLADAIRWYASPLAQVEDFTAELTFKPGSKRPQRPLKHTVKEVPQTMESKILEALKEMEGETYLSMDGARTAHSNRELLDIWLRYEGILGYTDVLLDVIETIYNAILEDAR